MFSQNISKLLCSCSDARAVKTLLFSLGNLKIPNHKFWNMSDKGRHNSCARCLPCIVSLSYREEYGKLFDFVNAKKLNIKNRGLKEVPVMGGWARERAGKGRFYLLLFLTCWGGMRVSLSLQSFLPSQFLFSPCRRKRSVRLSPPLPPPPLGSGLLCMTVVNIPNHHGVTLHDSQGKGNSLLGSRSGFQLTHLKVTSMVPPFPFRGRPGRQHVLSCGGISSMCVCARVQQTFPKQYVCPGACWGL